MNILNFINKILICVVLVTLPILINTIYTNLQADSIIYMNIGQGDSTLICNKLSYCGLIDTGKQSNVLTSIRTYTNKPLEFLLITHPDFDHEGQAIQILNQIRAKKVFLGKTDKAKDLINQILEKNIQLYELRDNNDFSFGNYKFDILWPKVDVDLNQLESNDTSTTMLIKNGSHSFFIAGDLGTTIEQSVQSEYNLSNIEILKLSHHGSKNSSSEDFLQKLNPVLSIISVGKNSYGHPSKQVLENLDVLHLSSLRTDQDGDIKISIFQGKLDINTQISKKSYIILN